MTNAGTSTTDTVTVIVHGTFARTESWWRLGSGGVRTFADQLESALAQRGCSGTVWAPALNVGMPYEAFDWHGGNSHRDRVAGARKLRASLADLAAKLGASEESPLTVNFVAHSHGGNVVLEALKRLPKAINVGRVVLLGTPLLTGRPALRPFRLFCSVVILALASLFLLVIPVQLIALGVTGQFLESEGISAGVLMLLSLPMVSAYAWIFLLAATVGDFVWRVVSWPFQPVRLTALLGLAALVEAVTLAAKRPLLGWELIVAGILAVSVVAVLRTLGSRQDKGVYGPAPKALSQVLRGKPAVLFTSHHDEADLLLKLGVAPREVYKEMVRKGLNPVLRILERVLFRPLADGLILRALEVVLERFVLGFSWLRVLFVDYEMADLDTSRAYPLNTVVQRIDVTEQLRAGDKIKRASGALVAPLLESEMKASQATGMARHKETLVETLREVGEYLKSQLRLRHSLYYESPEVIDRLADVLVEPRVVA